MALPNDLVGQSAGTVLLPSQIKIYIENGESSDYTVRQGVVQGMANGTAISGSGGYIIPSSFDETTETNTSDAQAGLEPEAKAVNQVRFDGQALKVNHANGDTVLYIACITSAGDIVGKYVS